MVRPKIADKVKLVVHRAKPWPHLKPSEVHRYEYRYPTRPDFIEFLLRLPAEAVGSARADRRSLMREALQGVVPERSWNGDARHFSLQVL